MKYAAILFVLMASPALGADFNTKTYCREVAAGVGGSYEIEASCRQSEDAARVALENMDIPARVENYCEQVAIGIGGSYEIMLTCVREELDARARLD